MPYTSSPSSPVWSRARTVTSFSSLPRDASTTWGTLSCGTTTTPAASPTTTSPALTVALAQLNGTLTEPKVSSTVPRTWLARPPTGKATSCSAAVSRTPPSITNPAPPRARKDVAKSSPKNPASDSVVHPATTTSPSCNCSAATCNIQLSPGCSNTVTAGPQSVAPS